MSDGDIPKIYQHAKRPQWGHCVVGRTEGDNRQFLFEGHVDRWFARDFWPALELVSLPEEEARAVDAKIRKSHAPRSSLVPGEKKPRVSRVPAARASVAPAMPFADQVSQFKTAFPEGFTDEKFVKEERGTENAGPKEGYKQYAIETAREKLGKDAYAQLLADGKFDEVFAAVKAVLGSTGNLLSAIGEIIPFRSIPAEKTEAVARALYEVLYGTGDFETNFDAWVASIAMPGKTPNWSLATIVPALINPAEHYFVRATLADAQALILGIETGRKPLPDGRSYTAFTGMAKQLGDKLRENGLTPRDLLDVYSFTWRTLHKAPARSESKKSAPKKSTPKKTEPKTDESTESESTGSE